MGITSPDGVKNFNNMLYSGLILNENQFNYIVDFKVRFQLIISLMMIRLFFSDLIKSAICFRENKWFKNIAIVLITYYRRLDQNILHLDF